MEQVSVIAVVLVLGWVLTLRADVGEIRESPDVITAAENPNVNVSSADRDALRAMAPVDYAINGSSSLPPAITSPLAGSVHTYGPGRERRRKGFWEGVWDTVVDIREKIGGTLEGLMTSVGNYPPG